MALNVYELARSRPLDRSVSAASVTLQFVAFYSADELAVNVALLSVAPTSFDGYLRVAARQTPQGAGFWLCEVEYAFSQLNLDGTPPTAPTDLTILGPEYAVDITAGQVHVTQSLATTHRWQDADQIAGGVNLTVNHTDNTKVLPSDDHVISSGDVGKKLIIQDGNGWAGGTYTVTAVGGGYWTLSGSPGPVDLSGGKYVLVSDPTDVGTAQNFKQAIGVTNGVAGTDVFTPHFEFGITAQDAAYTLPRVRQLRALCATVNGAPWRGFDTGEVLYLGHTATPGPNAVWVLAHKFAVGKNLVAVAVSDTLVVPYKYAWEYLWVDYKPAVGPLSMLQVPRAAYTEQVYQFANFLLLGLGA